MGSHLLLEAHRESSLRYVELNAEANLVCRRTLGQNFHSMAAPRFFAQVHDPGVVHELRIPHGKMTIVLNDHAAQKYCGRLLELTDALRSSSEVDSKTLCT